MVLLGVVRQITLNLIERCFSIGSGCALILHFATNNVHVLLPLICNGTLASKGLFTFALESEHLGFRFRELTLKFCRKCTQRLKSNGVGQVNDFRSLVVT